MNEKIHLYFGQADDADGCLLAACLEKAGYQLNVNAVKFDPDTLAMLILSDNVEMEDLFLVAPWLKKQYEYCSYPHLKLMPVFVYDSTKVDPEEAFEGKVGELYEELMSGEFKPFGFDKAKENPLEEFPRILDEYLD